MVFIIAHTLRRTYLRNCLEYTISTKLLPSCILEYQLTSIQQFIMDVVHLHCQSKFQMPRNQSGCLLPVMLKSNFSCSLCKQFSSKPGQDLLNVDSKSNQNKPITFTDSDTCLLFDAPGILISRLTYGEAKTIAREKKCRLVYMHKNSDGIFCFQLQKLPNLKTSMTSKETSERLVVQSVGQKRQQKNATKEFKIQATIGDHDLSIKLNKMKALLAKGKPLQVHILSAKNGKSLPAFTKQLTDELGDIGNIKQESSKGTAVLLNLTPKESGDKHET